MYMMYIKWYVHMVLCAWYTCGAMYIWCCVHDFRSGAMSMWCCVDVVHMVLCVASVVYMSCIWCFVHVVLCTCCACGVV